MNVVLEPQPMLSKRDDALVYTLPSNAATAIPNWEVAVAEQSATSGKPFVVLDLNGLTTTEVDWDGMARLQSRVRLYLLSSEQLSAPGHLPEAPSSDDLEEIEEWIVRELKHFDLGRPILIPDEMRARQSDPSCWFTLESFMTRIEFLAEKYRHG